LTGWRVRRVTVPMVAIAAVSCLVLLAGCGAAAGGASSPLRFAGVAATGNGLALYTIPNGKLQKVLTKNGRDAEPVVDTGASRVFFVRPDRSGCDAGIWSVSTTRGNPVEVASRAVPGGPFAERDGGKFLAYSLPSSAGCDMPGDAVRLVHDGKASTIVFPSDPKALAAGAGDALAVELASGQTATTHIEVLDLKGGGLNRQARVAASCPTHEDCAEMAPSFDARADLFYIAATPPRSLAACLARLCPHWRYDVMEQRRGQTGATSLASTHGRGGIAVSGTVDSAGTAMILSLPARAKGPPTIWEWVGHTLRPIGGVGGRAAQPAW
jgi:hypothetical protein